MDRDSMTTEMEKVFLELKNLPPEEFQRELKKHRHGDLAELLRHTHTDLHKSFVVIRPDLHCDEVDEDIDRYALQRVQTRKGY